MCSSKIPLIWRLLFRAGRPGLSGKAAWTLIELLVVIAIIGLLTAILIPTISAARTRALSVKCASNLKQWGTAYLMYGNDNSGALPTTYGAEASTTDTHDWQEAIASYLVPGTPGSLRFTMRTQYGCPCTNSACIQYGGNLYLDYGVYNKAPRTFLSIPNRVNTVIIAETPNDFWYITPFAGTQGVDYTRHGGRANFCFADGHGETLTYSAATNRPIVVLPQ
jgi:prepilin-type processing-associated H-X9-DG protein